MARERLLLLLAVTACTPLLILSLPHSQADEGSQALEERLRHVEKTLERLAHDLDPLQLRARSLVLQCKRLELLDGSGKVAATLDSNCLSFETGVQVWNSGVLRVGDIELRNIEGNVTASLSSRGLVFEDMAVIALPALSVITVNEISAEKRAEQSEERRRGVWISDREVTLIGPDKRSGVTLSVRDGARVVVTDADDRVVGALGGTSGAVERPSDDAPFER